LTVANVTLVIAGFWWAPWVGIVNTALNLIYCVTRETHINIYVMDIALLALNAFFLR
jgi:hypothetical protein